MSKLYKKKLFYYILNFILLLKNYLKNEIWLHIFNFWRRSTLNKPKESKRN